MPVEVAQGILNITPSMRGLQALIDREMRGADTRRAGREAGDGYTSGFGASAKKLTGVLSGAFAAVKIGDFAKSAVQQASDLVESGTKLQQVFGDATGSINDFADQGAKKFGQSNLAIKDAAGTFGIYGKAAGLAGKQNADFSKQLVGLSTDLASFYNTDPSQATEAIAAGLRGESEPLRQFGILLDDATLRNKAFALGLTDTTKNVLTPQQRVLAAQAVIMEQSTVAQGDFERTSKGLANQQRILSAQWTDMKGKLGAVFLPAVTGVVTALNDHLFPILDKVTAKFPAFIEKIKGAFTGGAGLGSDSPLMQFIAGIRDAGLSTFEKLRGIWDTLWSVGEKLWPSIKSIGESLAGAFSTLSGSGLTVWSQLLNVFQNIADSLNSWLVPSLEWLAKFMRENPASVLTFVGVILGVVGALKAWSIIQATLDALLAANPIGLIVVALAAFAAAVVWAYNNVGWFKDAVDAAWSFIKDATSKLWEGVLKPALTWIQENIHYVGDAATWLWQNAIKPAWDGISAAISWAWTNVIKPYMGFIWDVIQKVGQVYLWLWNNVVVPAFHGITAAISWAWNNVIKPVFGFIKDNIHVVGDTFSWLWNNIVTPVWSGVSSAVSGAWNNVIKPIFDNLSSGINAVGTTFSGLWDTVKQVWGWIWDKIQGVWQGGDGKGGIKGIWESIKGFASGVADFFTGIWKGVETAVGKITGFITDVFDAIKNFFTNTAEWDQTQIKAQMNAPGQQTSPLGGGNPTSSDPTGNPFLHADGGLIRGPGGPRDDKIPAMLSNREFVVNAKSTADNLPLLYAINAGKYADGGLVGNVGHYADGGIVAASNRATDMISALLQKRVEQTVVAKNTEIFGSALASANLAAFNSSQDPSSFGWQRAANQQGFSWHGLSTSVAGGTQGLWAALLDGLVGSIQGGIYSIGGFEDRNIAGTNTTSFHAYGTAMDINAPENWRGEAGYGRTGQYVIPGNVAHALAGRLGMEWGGDWAYTDPMHFEIHVPPNAISGATVSGGISGAANSVIGGLFGGTGGVEQWRSTAIAALRAAGQPVGYVDSLLRQMMQESSGNPNAINNTDSNAQRGDPSIGLMQVIGETFRNTLNSHGFGVYVPKGQRDPFANILASVLYTADTYGDLGFWARNGYGPYDNGGMLGPKSMGVNLLNKPEAVLTPRETAAYQAHAASLADGYGGHIVVNNYIDGQQLDARTEVIIDGAMVNFASDVRRGRLQPTS